MSTQLNVPLNIKGQFKLDVVNNKTGEVVKATEYSDNLVLDQFFTAYNDASSFTNLHARVAVGTGNSAPDITQTKLDNWLATNSTSVFNTGVVDHRFDSTTGQAFVEREYTFVEGGVVGNIAEIGLALSTASNPDVVTRALIVDGLGDPTTIAVSSEETLRVTYRLNVSINMDVLSLPDATINGVTTSVKFMLTAYGNYRLDMAGSIASGNYGIYGASKSIATDADLRAYLRSLFSISAAQLAVEYDGASGTGGTVTGSSVSNSSNLVDWVFNFGPNDGNTPAGGITALGSSGNARGYPHFILEFDPPIPKTDQDTLLVTTILNFIRA